MPFFVFHDWQFRERRNSLKNSLNPNLTNFICWNSRSLLEFFASSQTAWNFLWKPNLIMFLEEYVARKVKINLTTFIWNWKRKRLEGKHKWKCLKIKQLLHSLNKHLENFLVLTPCKRYLGFVYLLKDFSMFENAFSGGTFRKKVPNIFCMENVSGNPMTNHANSRIEHKQLK